MIAHKFMHAHLRNRFPAQLIVFSGNWLPVRSMWGPNAFSSLFGQECFSAPCQLRHKTNFGVQRLATYQSEDAGLLQVAKHVSVKFKLFAGVYPKCFLFSMDLGLFPQAFALASVGCARMLPQALARKYLACLQTAGWWRSE